MPTSPSVFRAGVVAVTAGSPVVTGTGTGFLLNGVTGGMFSLDGHAVPVLSVDSETQLTLAYDWPGETASGVADYAISLESALAADATFVHNRLVSVLEAIGALENARPNYEVQSVGTNAPPGSPAAGSLYVVGSVPTGAWAGHGNVLAQWTGVSWVFTSPEIGTSVVSAATGVLYVWNGATWLPYVAPSAFMQTMMDDASASVALSTLGVSAFAKTILDDADAAAVLTTLGFSSLIQGLRDDADQAAALTTLGAQAALGFTPVNKAGDTLTGALNMNSAAINGGYQLSCPNPTFLAAGALITYTRAGLYLVHNASTGAAALFFCAGTTGVTLIGESLANRFSTANGTSNRINLFYFPDPSPGLFVISNGYATQQAISVFVISTRSSV